MGRPKVKLTPAEKLEKAIAEAKENRFLESLIEEVRHRAILFDKTDPNRKDPGFVKKAWRDVAKACSRTEGECKKAWDKLREGFKKERLLRRIPPSGSDGKSRVPFAFFDALAFLDAHIQVRKGRSTIGTYEPSESEGAEEEPSSEAQELDTSEDETQFYHQLFNASQDMFGSDEASQEDMFLTEDECLILNASEALTPASEIIVNNPYIGEALQSAAKRKLAADFGSPPSPPERRVSPRKKFSVDKSTASPSYEKGPHSSSSKATGALRRERTISVSATATAGSGGGAARSHVEVFHSPEGNRLASHGVTPSKTSTPSQAAAQSKTPTPSKAATRSKTPTPAKVPAPPKTPTKNPASSLSPHLPILSPQKTSQQAAKTKRKSRSEDDEFYKCAMSEAVMALKNVAEQRRSTGHSEGELEDALGRSIATKLKKLPITDRLSFRDEVNDLIKRMDLVLVMHGLHE